MNAFHSRRFRSRPFSEKPVRTLTVLLIILLAAGGATFARQTRIGIHGGLGIPSIEGGTNEVSRGYTSRWGPYFGLFADYEVRPHLSLRGELNYSSQGGKRNGMQPIPGDKLTELAQQGIPPELLPETLYADFDNEAILDYLEIPLMAGLTWGRTMRLRIDAGPYIGFLVRAKTVTSGSSFFYTDRSGTRFTPGGMPIDKQSFESDTPIKQDINSTNAGIAGAIGLETPFGPGDIVVDAHFSYGLTNIQKDTKLNGENNTGSLAFTIGYSYPLHGGR